MLNIVLIHTVKEIIKKIKYLSDKKASLLNLKILLGSWDKFG